MLIKTLPVGQLETNCYVVTNEKTLECVVIDPGDESNTILNYLEDNHLKCVAILLTHGHWDHVGAVNTVKEETGVPVYMNRQDDTNVCGIPYYSFPMPKDGHYIQDGDVLDLAGLHFDVIGTPGHTPGGVTFRCQNALFTGDTLFQGSCGRTDLPGGDMYELLDSLKKLCQLKGDYEVYPGHMGSSSLERERMFNYYCRAALQR